MQQDGPVIVPLEVRPVREAFAHEAHQFTHWLELNIQALSDRLNMQLTVVQREKSVGDFSVDLECEDGEGRKVIVENQLERTDHTHLGQVLTYLVNLNANTAVWVTPEPRPEHQRVIMWLNEATPDDISFYLVRVEAIRIAGSPFAPLFTVLAGPDKQVKQAGAEKKEWAARQDKQEEFWRSLLERAKVRSSLFANISPSHYNSIGTGAGKSGIGFWYNIRKDFASVGVYIDHDHVTGEKNKVIYDALCSQRDEIEQEYGGPLKWDRMEGRRACQITKEFRYGGLNQANLWTKLQDDMIDTMIRFEKAIRPRLAAIKV